MKKLFLEKNYFIVTSLKMVKLKKKKKILVEIKILLELYPHQK